MLKIIIFSILIFLGQYANADFHDQGFNSAHIRTDYNSTTEGLSSNPVTFASPCLFPGWWCGTGPTVYSANYHFTQNVSGWPTYNYWVLSINNENSYNFTCPSNPDPGFPPCIPGTTIGTTNNPGAPNQSLPRAAPGTGLMGFTAIKNSVPGETFYRAHLVMNGTFPKPKVGDIPYLSVGAEKSRGNSQYPGYMNNSYYKHRVKFTTKLWDFKIPTPVSQNQPATLLYYLFLRSEWGGKPRGLFITLAHWNRDNSTSSDFYKKIKWNWPVEESFYHEGAELAFLDAEDVATWCGISVPRLTTIGQEISYDLDIQALFRCVSNWGGYDTSMPYNSIPILGVHWAVEMTGDNGWLWPSVHNMQMSW